MWPLTFLHALWRSISSVAYYQTVVRTSLWFSVRFFLIASFLLGLISGLIFSLQDLPRYHSQANEAIVSLKGAYPDQLVVAWDKSSLQLKPEKAVFVPVPAAFRSDTLPSTLIVIDPTVSSDTSKWSDQYKNSLMVAGSSQLWVISGSGGYSTMDLAEIPGFEQPFTIHKQNIGGVTDIWLQTLSDLVGALSIVAPLISPWWGIFSQSLVVLIEILFAHFCIRLLRYPWPFRRILQICLHVSVVAQISSLIGAQIAPSIAPFFTITFWAYLVIVLFSLRQSEIKKV